MGSLNGLISDAQLRLDLIRHGIIKPTEVEVFYVKQHVMRLVDDRPVILKHKKPGDGRSRSSQYDRR